MKLFDVVPIRKPKSSLFDLSHEVKTSFNMGELVPVLLQEVVPGDKFRVNTEVMVRVAPLIAPVMHRVDVFVHYFFVPNRIIWTNWEKFITGGESGAGYSPFPTVAVNEANKSAFAKGTLGDYLGVPPPMTGTITDPISINVLPFRAYQEIYNWYYRNQNFQTEIDYGKGDTLVSLANNCTLRSRNWEKDYFTSALPWLQRGAEVSIPSTVDYDDTAVVKKTSDNTVPATGNLKSEATTGHLQSAASEDLWIANVTGLNITVNDLRRATKLQRWLEVNALAGGRYLEYIKGHFGITLPDYRLAKPLYLGGGKTPIVVSEVLNTSDTASAPQGNMAGHGIGIGNTNSFSEFFPEHGYVMGIMSVLPRTAYQQGFDKTWLKILNTDYYFPEFANLGEQKVINSELYHNYIGTAGLGANTFGYQTRYAEYKYNSSKISGDFRDNLSFWHLGRIFSSAPALNSAFVTSDPAYRVFANTSTAVDHMYVQLYHNIRAIRPMPYFSNPVI